ncbi:MAG: alpha-ketoacid dehydrogenase subunit beta [Chlamydiae bacterium CG10_big_fil_rev_8_21_14_0_10_42_34]|nr:MAG: alpha-ketoacid dehydrogenase subunit beta [Chlamydiae bacterium CG10_big_fil_rev_8_21_14_0_10_42_34]
MPRQLKFHEAILEATDQKMAQDPNVYLMGLGVPDPKGIFGTTSGLEKKYGPGRVMDMPTSENAMTGIGIGSAILGMRPIMSHQRVDFFLLALDQLINNAAKWNYMFGGQMKVPLVIRLIIGRGWGQGPQHSQSLHSFFAHIPGLKVVMPSTPYDAKGLLISAIEDDNPVVFLEHRWLHNTFGDVPQEMIRVPIGKAKIVRQGTDVTIAATSHMVLEALKASKWLEKDGISAELIDLRTIRPLDKETLLTSVKKTGRLIVADPDWKTVGTSSEILAIATEEAFSYLKSAPVRVAYPDRHTPTSWALANHFYPTAKHIAIEALKMMGKPTHAQSLIEELLKQCTEEPLDVPDKEFTGPF